MDGILEGPAAHPLLLTLSSPRVGVALARRLASVAYSASARVWKLEPPIPQRKEGESGRS